MEKHNAETGKQPAPSGAESTKDTAKGREQQGQPHQTALGESTDISQIDQQEGQMNNGELGGNFDGDNK